MVPVLTRQGWLLGGLALVLVAVDGERVVSAGGTVSAFVLDGTGEARVMDACRTALDDAGLVAERGPDPIEGLAGPPRR